MSEARPDCDGEKRGLSAPLVFGALSNGKNLKIIDVLYDNGPLKYSDLCAKSGFDIVQKQSGLFNYYLRNLIGCGMVYNRTEADGGLRYSLTPGGFDSLRALSNFLKSAENL